MELNKNDYYNFLAIRNNLLYPLNKFMSLDECFRIAKNFDFKKHFFTIPFFLTASFDDVKKIKNNRLTIFFKKKKIYDLPVVSISNFKKEKLIDFLFDNSSHHPFKDIINNSKNYLIETANFSKKKKLYYKNRKITGFATRNIPHIGHEKIIKNIVKDNNAMILINSEVTKKKKTDIKKTIYSYKKFIQREKLQSKILLKKIIIPSTMLGYRQAFIHALIGRNLGCKKFIIGRDHSGYKKFYSEFQSYNFCKKNEKKLGIRILASGSPVFCKKCNQVVFRDECNCNTKKIDISASLIRNLKNNKFKKLISNF